MAASSRAVRILKAMNILSTKPTFDGIISNKLKLESVSNGSIQGSFTVDTSMSNMGGTLHGGYIASVTDIISLFAHLSTIDARLAWTTSMNVSYIGAAFQGDKINVTAKTVKTGSPAVVETYFHNEKGNLLAKGTTTFLVGAEKYQGLIKDFLDFDVYEN